MNSPFGSSIDFVIGLRNGTNPGGLFKYVVLSPGAAADVFEFDTESPTSYGHTNADGAIAVGAAFYQSTPEFNVSPPVAEGFSSLGGINILFDTSGNRMAQPELRSTVDIVGPDGGNTTFFGADSAQDPDAFPNFFGTSAAAPHVAGLAALLLENDPLLTPEGILTVFSESAIDMDNPYVAGFQTGFDSATGYGLVDGLGALGKAIDAPQLVGLNRGQYMVINDIRDLLDANPNDGVIDVDLGAAGQQVSLRAAAVAANSGGANATTLLIPAGIFVLTLSGTGGTTQGDLDITGVVTIVGAGPGRSIITAAGLATPDRLFEINGSGRSLDLSRVTLTGGNTTSAGGAIFVQNSAKLTLGHSAVVGNIATQRAGGVRTLDATSIISHSVFTNNQSGFVGGAVAATGSSVIHVGSTVFAGNSAVSNFQNVEIGTGVTARNNGYSLLDNVGGSGSFFTASLGDYINTGATNIKTVTSSIDVFDTTNNASVLSLREAVVLANNGGGTIWVPAWRQRLIRNGSEGTTAEFNDLDITAAVTIIGAGAGLSVIDASGLKDSAQDLNNRAFEVRGSSAASLNLSRVTVANGFTSGSTAGNAILVRDGASVEVSDSALVNHLALANGVAIRSISSNVTVRRCVFTNNDSFLNSMGAVYSTGSGNLTVGDSVFALNSVGGTGNQYPNVRATGTVVATSEGKNLYDHHNATDNNFAFNGTGDHSGSASYVVTSVADTFNHINDSYSLSLREAIELANQDIGLDEMWIGAWTYVLSRDRATFGGGSTTDTNVGFGDLDVSDSLVVRRAGSTPPPGSTAVKWAQGAAADALFDLLGDYNGDGVTQDDGITDNLDWVIWNNTLGSTTDLRADGNDNGIVDQADYDVWLANWGDTLALHGIG